MYNLYEKQKVSLGKASELAGIDKARFMQLLGSRTICINYDAAEFERDVSALKESKNAVNVVSDSSPPIALARIDRLGILHTPFDAIIIPDAVWR